MRIRSALLGLSLVLLTGGCRGCFCTRAIRASAETPPPDVIEEQTRQALAKNPSKLSTICGVRVSRLDDMKLTVVRAGRTSSDVRVEGTAVLADAGVGEAEDDFDDEEEEEAGVRDAQAVLVIDKTKARLCVGVVAVAITVVLDRDGHAAGWTAHSIEVDSVATAGVHYDKEKAKAKAAGGSHHHHHHHH